jgi:hypothetical protein
LSAAAAGQDDAAIRHIAVLAIRVLTLFTAACSTASRGDAGESPRRQAIIYGEDDRKDLYETDEPFATLARDTAVALIAPSEGVHPGRLPVGRSRNCSPCGKHVRYGAYWHAQRAGTGRPSLVHGGRAAHGAEAQPGASRGRTLVSIAGPTLAWSGRTGSALRARLEAVDAFDDALKVVDAFNAEGVEYVVVSGFALNVHGLVRATEDLDVFIRPDVENVARLRKALHRVWNDADIEQITAEDLCGDYPAVRYGPPEGTLYLDILTRLGEATAYADFEAEDKTIAGIRVRVATPRALFRMKRSTVHPLDHADAAALRAAFNLDEER